MLHFLFHLNCVSPLDRPGSKNVQSHDDGAARTGETGTSESWARIACGEGTAETEALLSGRGLSSGEGTVETGGTGGWRPWVEGSCGAGTAETDGTGETEALLSERGLSSGERTAGTGETGTSQPVARVWPMRFVSLVSLVSLVSDVSVGLLGECVHPRGDVWGLSRIPDGVS